MDLVNNFKNLKITKIKLWESLNWKVGGLFLFLQV